MLVWICRFPLPLGVWEGLRFVIVALPGLFSYLFLAMLGDRTLKYRRDVGPYQKMTMRAKVMVQVNMTFSTKKLLIWQCLS